ncbi:MAG: S8 family serine peptidase, partial [Patescibacteria group bacterium]
MGGGSKLPADICPETPTARLSLRYEKCMFKFTQRRVAFGLFALLVAGVAVWQTQPTHAEESTQLSADWHKPTAESFNTTELPFATDHILVKLKSGERLTVQVDSASVLDDALAAWSANPDVEYAEVDSLFHAYAQEESWGFTEVNAGTAASTNGATGSGKIVAVVDTGVDYNHEDLDANNWVNSDEVDGDNDDDDGNGYADDVYGYDFIGSMYTAVTPDSDPQDEHGHGTHVSGTIAAENNTTGVRGIAPSATIMPVKVLDANGIGWDSNIADGIRYAADNGADIINLSLGSSASSHTLSAAVDYAQTNGVLVVAAAGNSGTFTGGAYPAQYSNVVSVAASDEDGYKTYWSNWGKVDVIAPGDEILSTYPGNKYVKMSGTSMASPHAAGVAALIAQDSALTNNPRAIRHVLETTAADFGTQTGPDYVAGQGMLDALAATGTLVTEQYLYADTGWIKSDGEDTAVVTVSLRNSSNSALAGQTITWSTSLGTLTNGTSTTNSNGEAQTTLVADDVDGLATVTATTTLASTAATMQIAIVPDIVEPETVGVTPYVTSSDAVEIATGTASNLSTNVYSAGDEIQIWSYPTAYDRETHDEVTMTYSVTDPDGADVADLGGTSESVSVGFDFYGWFYIPQSRITSKPLTIPADAVDGKYTVTATITDADTTETSFRTTDFWVGEIPDVLLVYDSGYCSDTPVQGWDFGGIGMCGRTGHVLQAELEDLGYTVMLWDTTDLSYPYSTDMAEFPVVIWAAAGLTGADSYDLQAYMDLGGNVLLTSELTANYEGYSGIPSDFLWNYLHARYVSDIFTPDQVNGVASGIFDGLEFNTDYYDLNGDGVQSSFYANELELNDADAAEAILSYDVGNSTDKVAGVRVSTDTYRSAYLSFGLETINDGTGDSTKAHVLDTLVGWLLGDGPSITKVADKKVLNNNDRIITIKGTGFLPTGKTTVTLGGTEL